MNNLVYFIEKNDNKLMKALILITIFTAIVGQLCHSNFNKVIIVSIFAFLVFFIMKTVEVITTTLIIRKLRKVFNNSNAKELSTVILYENISNAFSKSGFHVFVFSGYYVLTLIIISYQSLTVYFNIPAISSILDKIITTGVILTIFIMMIKIAETYMEFERSKNITIKDIKAYEDHYKNKLIESDLQEIKNVMKVTPNVNIRKRNRL